MLADAISDAKAERTTD